MQPLFKPKTQATVVIAPTPQSVLDNVLDGSKYGKVSVGALTNNQVDLSKSGVLTRGAIAPLFSGSFQYVSTTNSITFYWDGTNLSTPITIYRADGTTVGPISGSQAITGLNSATSYYFYPYFDESTETIMWVTGGVGTPAIAQTSRTNAAAQSQALQGHAPLSLGGMLAATTAAGTGGGSGGGSGSCPMVGMLVKSKTRGVIKIEECQVGEWIESMIGHTQVVSLEVFPQTLFIEVILERGESVVVAPTHPFTVADEDTPKEAQSLSLSDSLIVRSGAGAVSQLSVVRERGGHKVRISCLPHHEFWCGRVNPNVLVHNMMIES